MKGIATKAPSCVAMSLCVAAIAFAITTNVASATILCKDEKAKGQYVCWDEATRYSIKTPRKHKNGVAKTKEEVIEEGKAIIKRIMAHTGRSDRVVVVDHNNLVVEDIPAWKVAFLRDDNATAQAIQDRFKRE